jgi:cobalt-zinc-cadmium efflux system outer membrane protein
MRRLPLVHGLVPGLALLLVGCATAPRDQGFTAVSTEVTARTGTDVVWNQGGEADRQVAERIRALLAADLTPATAVAVALLNSPRLHATYQELGVSQADLVQAGMLSNPTLTGAVKFFPDDTKVELGLAENLMGIFAIPARKRLAEAHLAEAQQVVLGEILSVIGETKRAAYRVLAAQQRLELMQTVSEAMEASFDLARRIHDAGNTNDLQFAGEQAAFEESKLTLHAAENAVVEAREDLTVKLGLWGPEAATWKLPGRLPDLPADPGFGDGTGLEKTAIARSTALAAQRESTRALGERFGVERLDAWFGNVDLGVAAERESTGDWGIGPEAGIAIPLFDQGQGRRAAAAAELERAARTYIATAVEIRAAVRRARAATQSGFDRARFVHDVLLPVKLKVQHEAMLHYNGMLTGPFQALAAKRDTVLTGRRLIDELEAYWLARSVLDQVLSGSLAAVPAMTSESMPATSGNSHD